MTPTDSPEQSWKLLVKAIVFLIPAIGIWWVVTNVPLTMLENFWMQDDVWRGGRPKSVLEANRVWFTSVWQAIPIAGICLILSYLGLSRRPKLRPAVIGAFLWCINLGVLVGVAYIATCALMLHATYKNDIAMDVFGSAENLVAMASAERVTAVRLHPNGKKSMLRRVRPPAYFRVPAAN